MRGLALAAMALLPRASLTVAQTMSQTLSQVPLPATQPTAVAPLPAAELPPGQRPPRRAKVTWADGQLRIDADNSSLNQILREICRETGMTVTGGVVDERVFGTYGPAASGKVLDQLLEGTGSNLMLVLNDQAGPAELVLTPRRGGPSPPSPQALAHDDDREAEDLPPQRIVPTRRTEPHSQPPARTGLANPGANGTVPGVPAAEPSAAAASPVPPPTGTGAPDTTTQQSPNGVKTPQQIYEQLLKLQQKSSSGQTTPQ